MMIKQLPDGRVRVSLLDPHGVRHTWIITNKSEAAFVHAICKAAWDPRAKGLPGQQQKGTIESSLN